MKAYASLLLFGNALSQMTGIAKEFHYGYVGQHVCGHDAKLCELSGLMLEEPVAFYTRNSDADVWQATSSFVGLIGEKLVIYPFVAGALETTHAYEEDQVRTLPRKVRRDLAKQLGAEIKAKNPDVMEVYSPVRVTDEKLCRKMGVKPGAALDLTTFLRFSEMF